MNSEVPHGRYSAFRIAVAILLGFVLLGMVVAGVALSLKIKQARGATQRVILPDGTRIEFLGTARGNQPFSSDTPFLKRARKILPARLQQRWLPAAFTATCGASSTNGLTVFLRVTRPGPPNNVPWSSYNTEDDTGFKYNAGGGYCSIGLSMTEQAVGVSLNAFPRRQKTFVLNLKNSNGAVIASFRVPNPDAGSFPEWSPQPLPQTVSNTLGTLTLLSIDQRTRNGGNAYLVPHWQFHSVEPGWSNARVQSWTCLDATGNEGQLLSPLEKTWKIRAQVMRQNASDFSVAEKFTLTNLPIKPANEFVSIDRSNVVAGVNITALVLCGPGCLVISGGTRAMDPSRAGWSGNSYTSSGNGTNSSYTESWGAGTNSFFLVQVANLQPNDAIQFFLHDDRGREVRGAPNGWSQNGGGTPTFKPEFTPSPDAKSLTLEIVVNRPKIFEFLVDPKDVKTVQR